MKSTRIILVSALSAMTLGLGACADMTRSEKATAVGAAVGGVAGSAISGGSAAGTLGGAAIGGYVGNRLEKKDRDR
jgi:osmotically inducible lipoprotein OsmB